MKNLKDHLHDLLAVDGALSAALIDANSGMLLGAAGSAVDLEVAAAGNTEVLRATVKTVDALRLGEGVEDIVVSLGHQLHLLHPLVHKPGLFLFCVLDKGRANLAQVQRRLHDVAPMVTV